MGHSICGFVVQQKKLGVLLSCAKYELPISCRNSRYFSLIEVVPPPLLATTPNPLDCMNFIKYANRSGSGGLKYV